MDTAPGPEHDRAVLDAEALDDAARAAIELIDLGCGPGRSLRGAMRRFDARGIGIERHPGKVRKGQAEGLPVYRADILEMDLEAFPNVQYVTIDNVLEHLPTLDAVEALVATSIRLAKRVVHIRHPSFEDVDYLAGLGLKQYWTDWPGVHTAPVRLHEFVAMANRAGVYRILIHPVRRALDASDPTILPIDAPPGQHREDRSAYTAVHGVYDPERHGAKPAVTFDRPVYFAFDILLITGPTVPQLTYRDDPEASGKRPWLTWPGDRPVPKVPVRAAVDRARMRAAFARRSRAT